MRLELEQAEVDLVHRIVAWRRRLRLGAPASQLLCMAEEVGELYSAQTREDAEDAVGDVAVTAICAYEAVREGHGHAVAPIYEWNPSPPEGAHASARIVMAMGQLAQAIRKKKEPGVALEAAAAVFTLCIEKAMELSMDFWADCLAPVVDELERREREGIIVINGTAVKLADQAEMVSPARAVGRAHGAIAHIASEMAQGFVEGAKIESAGPLGWDAYFVNIAQAVSLKSKDRSTKVGAIVVSGDGTLLSTGYNGFVRGLDDDDETYHERPAKYKVTAHAELNAVVNAARNGVSLKGATLYLNFDPNSCCSECAKAIVQVGITRIVGPNRAWAGKGEHWAEDMRFSKAMLDECGVVRKAVRT